MMKPKTTLTCCSVFTALVGLTLLVPACSGEDNPYPGCDKVTLEPAFMPSPLAGMAVSPQGTLNAPAAGGRYVVSTTYIALKPDAGPRFGQLMGPIMGRLKTQMGVAALSFSQSMQCNTGRTLTVWADQASMYNFVQSPEHNAAVLAVKEVSRGTSVVSHRDESDPTKASSWQEAAKSLGPVTTTY